MPMLPLRSFMPAIACLLGLGGCVAAPLAQMAVTQMTTPKPPCQAPAACPAAGSGGTFSDLSKGFDDSLHKLTSLAPDMSAAR